MKLRVVPLELREANTHIEEHHRHHGRVQGHRFSIGVVDESDNLLGCAVVGRPTSGLDPKKILEVTRLCSDGTGNICSMLYSAAARAGKALGYERIQTYIFESENGASLKASGWVFERKAHPSGRHRKRTDGKERDTTHVSIPKTLWVKQLNKGECTKEFAHHRRKASTNEGVKETSYSLPRGSTMQDQKLAAHLSDLANLFRQVADGIDGLYDVLAHSTESSVPVTAEQAAPAPAPGGTMTLEQFNAKVVSLIRDNPNRGPAAKALLTRYAPNGGGAPAVDPAQYQNFIAELEQAQ